MLTSTSRILLAALSIALATACPSSRSDPASRLREASSAIDVRLLHARIPQFERLAEGGASRGSESSRAVLELRAAALDVLANAESSDAYVVAVAELIAGRPGEAVARLEARPRNTAAEWAALSGARIEHAMATNDTRELLRAIGAADLALEIDSHSRDALYNRMIALDLLGFSFGMRDAATRYLAADAFSGWADEARRRKPDLVTPQHAWKQRRATLEARASATKEETVAATVNDFPQQARSWAEVEYLGNWADAVIAEDASTASHWLQLARAIGNALRHKSGEALLASAVTSIDTAQQLANLAAAHRLYRAARREFHARRAARSLPMFLQSERLFRDGRSDAMANVAAYFAANALYDLHRDQEAGAIAERVSRNLAKNHLALRAQLHWLRSSVAARAGRTFDALAEANESLRLFEHLGEFDNAVRMRSACATSLIILGRTAEGWRMHGRAFSGAALSGSAWLIEQVLNDAVRNAIRDEEWFAARALVSIQAAEPSVSPRLRVDALLWRDLLETRVRGEAPRPTFASARAASKLIPDPTLRADAMEDLDFATALMVSKERPGDAAAALTRVIERQTDTNRTVDLASAHLERGRAHRALGDTDGALKDFLKAVEIIRHTSASIDRDLIRDTFFGRADTAFAELADLLAQRGQYDDAFRVSDEARARLLVEREERLRGNETPRSVDQIRSALPAEVVLVHYTTFADRMLIMTIERDGKHVVSKPLPQPVDALGEAFVEAIARGDDAGTARFGRELYDILIDPVHARLSHGRTLVVVPDDSLTAVPFCALIDPAQRYLIESVPVIVAPSAATFVHLEKRAERSLQGQPLNVFADPAFDQRFTTNVPRLPAAAEEARRLERRVANARVVIGSEATRRAFVDLIRRRGILHVAAHAITNGREASLSVIPLAPSAGDRGLLYLQDVAALDLSETPMVVLAGCRTASPSAGHGSMRSLSNAFLAAGAHSVVGSLWNVDDVTTADLSLRFYRHVFEGHAPAEALRLAQLELIQSSNARLRHVRAWGALQMYGRG
jgi:CHAT domain-containing protein